MEAQAQSSVRERIIQHATRLFAERGFDGVSLQSIADAVGVRKPSLLYHFPSKEALRTEVMDRMLSHWKDELPRILAAAQSGKDRFRSGMDALTSFFIANPDRARLVVREMLDRPAAVRELLGEQFQPWTRMLTDYIRMGQAAGSVRPDVDPESWVTQVVTMVIGTAACGPVTGSLVRRGTDGKIPSVRSQIDELVRISSRSLFNSRPNPEDSQNG
jgi:AcrR family transcriptional regulator